MAGDWLKWCKTLPEKPEVFVMAERLSMDRDHVAAKLMRLWNWCDDNISEHNIDENGHATVTLGARQCSHIDSIVGVSGFAEAMSAVSWLHVREGALTFPNFTRHNGEPAKQRALTAERQRRSRANRKAQSVSRNCHAKTVTREEKRRGISSSCSEVPERSEGTNGSGAETARKRRAVYPAEFEAFYDAYPAKGRKGKKAALARWKEAQTRLIEMGDEDPVGTLQRQCEAFARSPKARSYCWNVTTWLNEGHYEDEPTAWGAGGVSDDPRGTFGAAADYLESMKGKPRGLFG